MATSASHTPISRVPAHLEPLIQEERARCTSLGLQLKIPLSVLQDLEKKSKVKKSIRKCFLEMWQQWFKDKGERKWIEIFEALKQQRHNRLRNILEKKYKPDTIVPRDLNFEGELKEMIPKWYLFGCALGVSTTDMDIIKDDEGSSEVYMQSLLEEWNKTHEDSYTWETLQEALRVIGNNRLAAKLEEHRLQDKQVGDSKLQEPSTVKQSEPDISAEKKKTREREEETHEDKILIDTAMKAFDHWVTMRLSKFRTMGAPGSGKTSVLDLTMGKPPSKEEERGSTDCIKTREISIAPILAHEGVWETVDTDRMNEMVGKALKAKIDQHKKTQDIPPTTTSSSRLVEIDQHKKILDVLPTTTSSSPSRHPTRPREEVAQESTQPLKFFTDLVDKLEEIEGSMELMEVHWVFTQDTGGQPCYQSVAPLLLRENSCSVITTKLNEEFGSEPEFAYFIKGKPIPMSSAKIQLTNLQMIETLVKSQASVNPSQAHKYIIVGTHDDKAEECKETIGTKNAKLKEMLSGLEDQRINNGTTIIFPINAVNPNEEERKEKAKWLRRKILKSRGATVEERVNIRWFGLLLHLITEDKDTYTLDECLDAGKRLKMDEKEIKEALEFFHGLGIMIYFDTKDLGGVIIVKVKVVFSTLSLLLGISFIDGDTLDREFELNLSTDTQESLQKYGRFKKELLEDENEKVFQFSDVFTAEYFLHLLEHVTAVIAVGEDEYFLPSALAFATDEEIEQRVQEEGEPWIICLTRRKEKGAPIDIPPPPPYLPSVFINVLKSSSEYKLPSGDDVQQYSNAMSLSYGSSDSSHGVFIHFIQRVHQIEVYFSLCEDQPHKCQAIRSAVLEATESTEKILNIPRGILVKNDAFLCPCEANNTGRHVYVFDTDMKKAWCNKSKKRLELKLSQQRWLPQEMAPKEQPGWSSKVTRKEVTRASVDAYTGAGKPPFCEMTMTAASSQSTPPPLPMDVELEGTRLPENLPIQAPEEHELESVGVSKLQEPSTVKQSEPDISAEKKKTRKRKREREDMKRTHEGKLLTSDDLRDVLKQLIKLDRSKFWNLGLELGLKSSTLDNLEHKSISTKDEFWRNVILAWLNQEDNVEPSWRSLIDALESDLVSGKPIAQKIRDWLNSR